MKTEERFQKLLTASPEQVRAIDQILSGGVPEVEEDRLIGMIKGAKFVGVSRQTLWRTIKAGRLEKVELFPGSYRIRLSDLKRIRDTRSKKSVTAVNSSSTSDYIAEVSSSSRLESSAQVLDVV